MHGDTGGLFSCCCLKFLKENELPDPVQPQRSRILWVGLSVECGVGVGALLLGRVFGFSPLSRIRWSETPAYFLRDVGMGCLAAVPLLVILILLERSSWTRIRRLRAIVEEFVVPVFRGLSIPELAALSMAAGLGEELLFRGLVQGGLAVWIGGSGGPTIALVVASVLFGLCHFVSIEYFAVATIVGFYLGLLFQQLDSLIVPVVAHAGYDFLAFLYLLRRPSSA